MDRFLDGVFCGNDSIFRYHPSFRISIKTRVGYNDTSDLPKTVEILNRYPIFEITVHPRVKKDIYAGKPRMEAFDYAVKNCKAKVVYNGDVYSAEDHDSIIEKYSDSIKGIMIGRGAIADPGIFRQIRTGKRMTTDELYDFLRKLYDSYKEDYSPENALSKLKEVWSYTTMSIDDEKDRARVLKSIIKSRNEREYFNSIMVARQYLEKSLKQNRFSTLC